MKIKYAYFFIPLLILLGVYYWYDSQGQEEKVEVKNITPFANLDPSAVAVVEITTPETKLRILRDADYGWMIMSPQKTPADNAEMDKLFKDAAAIKVQRDLGAIAKVSASEYGLESPIYALDMLGEAGKVLLSFDLGTENTSGTGTYAVDTDGQLVLLQPDAAGFSKIGYEDLRSKHPFNFDRNTLSSFEVSTAQFDYAFEQRSGLWYLTRPEEFRASEGWCDGFLELLERLNVTQFIEGDMPSDLVPLSGGVRTVDKNGKSEAISFLGLDKVKGVAARSKLLHDPFYCEFRVVDYANVKVDELRETRLMRFTKTQIRAVVFREVGGENFAYKNDNGKYVQTLPEGHHVTDQSLFNNFLDIVLDLRSKGFIKNVTNFQKYGLEPYWIKIELYKFGEEGKVLLYIGSEMKDGYYANLDKENEVLILSLDDINKILEAANKIRR